MSDRIPSRRDHQKFCTNEGWTEVRNARGKSTQHHITYELALVDGRILRTRVSRPANTNTYGKNLWAHILRDQLDVTSEDFWRCVDSKILPSRGKTVEPPDAIFLPAGLAYQLVHTLHLSNEQIAGLTLDEAVQLMREFWEHPPAE